jgi:2-polyprenyl-3-methyl-5-hydroxy-6-metoxy-1,4-benzoquinol methylase
MNGDPPAPAAPARGLWQTLLDFEQQDAGHYLDYVNVGLLGIVDSAPQRVLELGCAGGMFGATLKQKYPQATVVGIEAGRAAAAKAGTRLDRVICARLEEVDFVAEGMRAGEFDMVIAADVLEHLANPWELLTRLKPLLAPRAQVLASIPNVRNIWLLARALLDGRWEYTERGLLDITHLRFFTRQEMHRMFAESGYTVEAVHASILPSLQQMYRSHPGGAPAIKLGRMTITDVTAEEMLELCAEQFLLRCSPA